MNKEVDMEIEVTQGETAAEEMTVNHKKVTIDEAKVVPYRKVEVTNLTQMVKKTYFIVNSYSEVGSNEDTISIDAPIAQLLLNHKVGDEVEYQQNLSGTTIKLRIDKIITLALPTDEAFLYLCFSQEDKTRVYPICKILDDKNIPYLLTPLSEYNGWDGIKEILANIESAKLFLWGFSEKSHKDDFIADIIEYVKQIKNENEIIEYDLNNPNESIGDLCSIIEKRLGLDPEGLFTIANELNETGKLDEAIELYKKAADGGHSGAQAKVGICYYLGNRVVKDHNLAVSYLKKAAEQGEPTAQYYLGECYMNGDGLEKNVKKAFDYYQEASNQGNLDALTELGRCYYDGISWLGEEAPDGGFYMKYCQDYNKAVELFSKAAERGHPKAQNYLGICYENGRGVKKDQGLAFKWYQRSAEQNDPNGQLHLGNCYYKGIGTPKDPLQAVIWYTKAKELGNDQAACNLGWCYEQGEGVMVQDDQMAAKCYLPAAFNGFSQAQYNVGRIFDKYQKYSEAYEWYKKAADQGYSDAQCALALMYKNGNGVNCNYSEAFIWLLKALNNKSKWAKKILSSFDNSSLFNAAYEYCNKKEYNDALTLYHVAADRGYAPALCNLGWMHSNGCGVTKDLSEANKWYRKAAEKGNRVAQMNLADNLEKGNGINQDYSEAFKWYKKATTGTIGDQREMVARARYTVARYYENGLGIPKDINEAIIWYERAGSYKDAKERMEYLKKENSLTNKIFKLFK